mmetsp:Transcript_33299/g.94349  ORF Transcript_33299/g.94349 Transcript_33299/m.94349 type:complete len:200 (-) Transcript_33299:1380-1979(-)
MSLPTLLRRLVASVLNQWSSAVAASSFASSRSLLRVETSAVCCVKMATCCLSSRFSACSLFMSFWNCCPVRLVWSLSRALPCGFPKAALPGRRVGLKGPEGEVQLPICRACFSSGKEMVPLPLTSHLYMAATRKRISWEDRLGMSLRSSCPTSTKSSEPLLSLSAWRKRSSTSCPRVEMRSRRRSSTCMPSNDCASFNA